MNGTALNKIKSGDIEGAVLSLAGSNSSSKKKAVRNTILVLSQLIDDEWDAIDDWAETKLSNKKEP